MKIGEVAQATGIRTSTIRYYEEIGLLPTPRRESGQRIYDASIFILLKRIRQMQAMGFTLNETRHFLTKLTSSPRAVLDHHLAEKLRETQDRITHSIKRKKPPCKQD